MYYQNDWVRAVLLIWMTRQHFRASSLYIDASNLEHTILRSWTGKAHRESFRIGVVHSQNKPLREWKFAREAHWAESWKIHENTSFDPKVKVDCYTNCCKEHVATKSFSCNSTLQAYSFKLFDLAPAHSSNPLGRVGSMTLAASVIFGERNMAGCKMRIFNRKYIFKMVHLPSFSYLPYWFTRANRAWWHTSLGGMCWCFSWCFMIPEFPCMVYLVCYMLIYCTHNWLSSR